MQDAGCRVGEAKRNPPFSFKFQDADAGCRVGEAKRNPPFPQMMSSAYTDRLLSKIWQSVKGKFPVCLKISYSLPAKVRCQR